jgi:hypothetical protein
MASGMPPPPTPSWIRPSVSTLSDAAVLASITGGRSCRSATLVRKEMRSVTADRCVIRVQASRCPGWYG